MIEKMSNLLHDFDIHIEKLGSIDNSNIFGFYKCLAKRYDLKNHALLESASESTKETLYSFIALQADFILKINEDKF